MNKKIGAVIVGTAHMHVNEIAEYISTQPDFELVIVYILQNPH